MPQRLLIVNALVRIDGMAGIPRKPFVRPDARMDFWVLELMLPMDISFSDGCQKCLKILHRHKVALSRFRGEGGQEDFRLESSFVEVLAGLKMAFEFYHCREDG